MRTECIDSLTAYAHTNPDVMLLTADLGYSVLERFADTLATQYANVGVCEQAMIGIAAGLTLSGRRAVVYSIANFPTLRCLEQIRNDICYHNLPVVIIAVGGGLAYGAQGYTHHGVEDLGIMAMLPNMTVVCPADAHEVEALLPQILERRGPTYMRLGRSGEPLIHTTKDAMTLGRGHWVRKGHDIAFLCTGPIISRALKAAEILAAEGIYASVASFHTISPLDKEMIIDAAKHHAAVMTVEEHVINGGFGSIVASVIFESGEQVSFSKFGISSGLIGMIGDQSWLLDQLGSISDHARTLLKRK